jgi:branched-subunit amino acid aminotransferase/4-amino-4-deoxychorismate lyase
MVQSSLRNNRAFMYGESVFTTTRMQDGEARDWGAHLARLFRGADFVYGPFSDEGWSEALHHRIEEKLREHSGDGVLRVSLSLEEAHRGLSAPVLRSTELSVQVTLHKEAPREARALRLRSCPRPGKPAWWPSFLKAGNYLESILARKLHLRPGEDDLLYVDGANRVLETSISNVFAVFGSSLRTPPLGPDVLAGITRDRVLALAPELFTNVEEVELSLAELQGASAVFVTSSVQGLRPVESVDEVRFPVPGPVAEKLRELARRLGA